MTQPSSYLVCGTPRTGSTLLCDLLASTGVAGRPESFFREPDRHLWAERFGLPVTEGGSGDHRAFLAGAVRAGSTGNGVFAARVMWGTMQPIVEGLRGRPGAQRDIDVLVDAFGPLRLVHLRRQDVVGQAVSWARAEQTGHWQDGDLPLAEPHLDLEQIDHLLRTIHEHDAAWREWFARQGVQPLVLTYEGVAADPHCAVSSILDYIGVELPPGWRPMSPHRKQADRINADWVRRYRSARPR